MATKTFKIGLSNTDKQNMAQDVYERLLALTFPEYDSAEEYEIGDFVVYNDQLYKCIGATTGAWDSTKWQLATLNDLVTDIEGAVAFVNDKANVDGNYPTMTVGEADNLTPYDEEAGAEQNKPFFFQATGTANGSDPDFVTGSAALMREKRGNTVVVNQLVQDNFATGDGWAANNVTVSFSDNQAHITGQGTLSSSIYKYGHNKIAGHTYLVILNAKASVNSNFGYGFAGKYRTSVFSATTNWQAFFDIFTAEQGVNEVEYIYYSENNETLDVKSFVGIDLTQWFNGDIPQDLLDHPDHFFRYYQGSLAYNEGALVNANSRYIKCIGRQQWDEEWEVGGIDNQGQDELYNGIRSKGYIQVVPNIQYYFYCGINDVYRVIYFYDKDKNFISLTTSSTNGMFQTPSNCLYVRISLDAIYGATYNNDITISIYYDYESGYDQYYPYEELTNNDTGNEILRSAGDAADTKAPDGTITRKVGVIADLSSLTWYLSSTGLFYSYGLQNIAKLYGETICSMLPSSGSGDRIYIGYDTILYCYFASAGDDVNAFKTAMSGATLNYELAEATTEQGTSFSENLVIHDFGTMDFSGTSGVPQGNAIFYPVDYKAYLDTLHKYTEGDASNLALNSELNAKFESYLKSLTGYNASETQVLKNVEGTLTWVTEGE